MKIFKKISKVLYMEYLKNKLVRRHYKGMTEEENKYLNRIKSQNPFGLMVMILGGAAFAFGPMSKTIPLFTILFALMTFGTFDKDKEDNPWPFYIGIGLSVIGLTMNILGMLHEDYLLY